MSDELLYTSAPRGLRPGTSGFCTVAVTGGLGPAWVERLESMGGYKPLYPAGDARAADNPVAYAYARVAVAGKTRSVLSRACFSGFDHTGRTNKFVHYLLPGDVERGPGGPAWAMRQRGVMDQAWDGGEPHAIDAGRPLPADRPPAAPAKAWAKAAGDAAWAAALAGVAEEDPAAVVYLVYPAGTDVLALFDEAIRLLPSGRRWSVTFNTYLTEQPAGGAACAWRGVVAGTPAAKAARGRVIDLTALDPSQLPTGPLADAARTGRPAAAEVESPPPGRTVRPRPAAGAGAGATAPYSVAASATAQPPTRVPPSVPSNVRLAADPGRGRRVAAILSVAAGLLLLVAAGGAWFALNHFRAEAEVRELVKQLNDAAFAPDFAAGEKVWTQAQEQAKERSAAVRPEVADAYDRLVKAETRWWVGRLDAATAAQDFTAGKQRWEEAQKRGAANGIEVMEARGRFDDAEARWWVARLDAATATPNFDDGKEAWQQVKDQNVADRAKVTEAHERFDDAEARWWASQLDAATAAANFPAGEEAWRQVEGQDIAGRKEVAEAHDRLVNAETRSLVAQLDAAAAAQKFTDGEKAWQEAQKRKIAHGPEVKEAHGRLVASKARWWVAQLDAATAFDAAEKAWRQVENRAASTKQKDEARDRLNAARERYKRAIHGVFGEVRQSLAGDWNRVPAPARHRIERTLRAAGSMIPTRKSPTSQATSRPANIKPKGGN